MGSSLKSSFSKLASWALKNNSPSFRVSSPRFFLSSRKLGHSRRCAAVSLHSTFSELCLASRLGWPCFARRSIVRDCFSAHFTGQHGAGVIVAGGVTLLQYRPSSSASPS
ncbi:hypothetical protein TRVL_09683 [Trypanosoma vivax]|nr:hypothetical protein TRVL_09683 [Trypanosoma vivax]